jgi:formylglycine-generating enzyme required for sulfatase activity
MSSIPRILALALAMSVILLTGCGGGGGGAKLDHALGDGAGAPSTTPPAYLVLDLRSGASVRTASVPGLATDPLYRDALMAFRLVDCGSAQVGTAASGLGAVIDPPAATVAVAPFYLAVFETSQAQWRRLAGTTPWTGLVSATSPDDVRVGDAYPAIGISIDAAVAACASGVATRFGQLALPSDVQWEAACRAGSTGAYAWGGSATRAQIAAAALVWSTADGVRGARPVGVGEANAFGLYDMHGNVWEPTREGHLRGGSWNDPLAGARAANRAPIDPATAHLLVGVRFTYQPAAGGYGLR